MTRNSIVFTILLLSVQGYYQEAEEYYARGNVKVKLKDHLEAIVDYTRTIELDPNIPYVSVC